MNDWQIANMFEIETESSTQRAILLISKIGNEILSVEQSGFSLGWKQNGHAVVAITSSVEPMHLTFDADGSRLMTSARSGSGLLRRRPAARFQESHLDALRRNAARGSSRPSDAEPQRAELGNIVEGVDVQLLGDLMDHRRRGRQRS